MKKRLILLLLAAITALSMGACGKEAVETGRDNPKQSEDEIEKEKGQKEDRTEGSREEAGNGENRQETGEKEDAASSSGVRLGGDFDEKYDGFSYLKCETLILKPDEYRGITEEKELKIFLPVGDYASVNENSGYADSRGVNMKVTLAPYLRWDDDEHTLEEDLAFDVEMNYDEFYRTEMYDLELSKIETTENGARCVAKYCYYDRWTDSYIPVYCTYYLTKVGDEKVLVEVEINMMDAADDMEKMLAELEEFYDFDIAWDAKEAQKKLDDFIAAGVPDTRRVSTGYLVFEIPKDWEADYSYGYEVNSYAPGGSVAEAGCGISITREYMGLDRLDITEMLSSQEAIDQYMADFQESTGYDMEDMKIEYYGSTCLGEAMIFTFMAEYEESKNEGAMFLITDENYFSVMIVTAFPDKFESTMEVAENILANGKMHQ
ncbi:MAG: hypothetical protein HDR14_16095 [Lachnospiraceae bacterium]|nr:hypothetical protein [Lachnospiraceae bacterium]